MAGCHVHSVEITLHLALSLVDTDENNAVHYLIHVKTMRKFYTFFPDGTVLHKQAGALDPQEKDQIKEIKTV